MTLDSTRMALTVTSAAWAITVIWLVFKVVDYIGLTRKLNTIPSTHTLISSNAVWGNITPPSWSRIARGGIYPFVNKRQVYEEAGWNVIALLSPFPRNDSVVWISDAGIVKRIVNDRILFPKPLESYKPLEVYGKNVISTEGEEWKRHRRVSQPAFSEVISSLQAFTSNTDLRTQRNNKLVWNAATNTMMELFEDVWGNEPEIHVKNLLDITTPVALMVLSIAGFGKDMHWKNKSEETAIGKTMTDPLSSSVTTSKGEKAKKRSYEHTMTFTDSLTLISTHVLLNVIVPSWLKFLTKKARTVKRAGKELGIYMDELINMRIEEGISGTETNRGDLLSNLVVASSRSKEKDENTKSTANNYLSHTELRGNTYMYLLAGHETTAHTLTYMYGLLALYPDEQEKLFYHIKEIVGNREAAFDDFPALTRVMAALYETLRMFPAAPVFPKRTAQATVFTNVSAVNPDSREVKDMVIPSGTMLYVHAAGLHYNERYWPDPYTFKPDRFLGDWNKDAFIPFSAGARACMGKRFAEVEATAVTVALLRNYSIHLSPEKEKEYEGLSVYEKTDKLMKSLIMITLTPLNVPLVFKRRV